MRLNKLRLNKLRLKKLRLKKLGQPANPRGGMLCRRFSETQREGVFFVFSVAGPGLFRPSRFRQISCGQSPRSILCGIGHLGLEFPSLIKETTRLDFAGSRVVRGCFKIDNRPVWKFGILK